jgi:hypothetical protein
VYPATPPGRLAGPTTTAQTHIKSGDAGNWQTVGHMRRLARAGSSHPLVRQTAVFCMRDVSHLDATGMIGGIKQYLSSIPFANDPFDDELLYEPAVIIRDHAAGLARVDCDDIATLGAALARSVGLRTAFVLSAFLDKSAPFAHVYTVASSPYRDDWIALDTTRPAQVRGEIPVTRSVMIPV